MHGRPDTGTRGPDFLADGGEMGALMRAHDWIATPLGDPMTWPQPLKTLVGVMLGSNQPMFVAWGSERTLLYNDPYAEILASKHPSALGRGFLDVWHEIRADLVPIVEQAYAGQPVHMDDIELIMERSGSPEETHFAFSYTPVLDETGSVAGFFCPCREITSQVLAERRQAFRLVVEERLRDLGDPDAVMQVAVTMLGEHLRAARVGYGQVQSDDATVRLSHCYAVGVEPLVGDFPLDSFGPGTIERQRRGETEACPDILADPNQDPAVWAAIDTRAFVSVPLVRNGRFLASLYVNAREPRRWTAEDVALIEDVAARTWAAVERTHAVAALRQSEERYRTLFEAIDAGFCVVEMLFDREGRSIDYRFVEANPAFSRQTGLQSAVGRTARELVPDLEPHWFEIYGQVALTGEPVRFEQGSAAMGRWFDVHALRVGDPQDRRVAILFNDISERRRTEEQLRDLNATLEQRVAERTAERDKIWLNSSELMAVFSNDGRRLAINPAWSRVLGYGEDALVNKPMFEITHPDDVEGLKKAVQRLMRGEIVDPFEDRLRHANGTYRTISWTGVPGNGVFYAIGRDVTEHRHAEEQLRQAQKMEAVGQLTGGVAHDFNNLLTIIKSSTDLLRRPDLAEERRRRYVDAISDTVDRASKLTSQLLAFARRQALKPEVFDVAERVRALGDMLRTILGSRIQIVTQIACESCLAEADVTQFETALVNIAVNARDAMDGEGTLTVRVESLSRMPPIRGHGGGTGEFVVVSLSDTGSGIPADKLSQIFEPFFTTKEVGKGTGLGLSQVYGFAKQSGGDVDVKSTAGRGTTFSLYLPQVKGKAAARAGASDHIQDDTGRGRRVLVVEDNVEVGRFSTQLLRDLGYETTWAANAAEALKLLNEYNGQFDVVFSDVVMPGMSGVELGEEIRRLYPGLPVVLTSGYSHVLAEEGRHGFELLHKPYAVEDLSRVLHRVTRHRVRA